MFIHNYLHDNNNPNVPSAGAAAAAPVGAGMSVTGGRSDTIMDNRFVNNDACGVIFSPYLDSGPPCTGGTFGPTSCSFDNYGNALLNNTFSHNGSDRHPTNGDFAALMFEDGHPTNCFRGNTEPSGASVQPASSAALQQTHPTCNGQPAPASSSDSRFLGELLCDSQLEIVAGQPASCPTGQYPRRQRVIMHPLPKNLKTMPNPCAGVPANPLVRVARR